MELLYVNYKGKEMKLEFRPKQWIQQLRKWRAKRRDKQVERLKARIVTLTNREKYYQGEIKRLEKRDTEFTTTLQTISSRIYNEHRIWM